MAKVAIIHHSGVIGGAGISLLNTIRALAPIHEVTVYVSDCPTDIIQQLNSLSKELNVKIESYGRRIGALTYYNGGDDLKSPRFYYRASLIAKQWRYWNRTLRRLNPDVVITNSIILSWMSFIPEVKSRASICFVRETIQGRLKSAVNKIIRRFLCKYNRVVFLSDYDRDSWDFPSNQSVVIRNFINVDALDNTIDKEMATERLGLYKDSFHILYVGGVSHMKGFDIAVKSVLELNKEVDAELIVAGVDFEDRKKMGGGELSEYEKGIQTYIDNHEFKNKIHIIGRQMNMSECYAVADVLVVPMRSAHQARPVFEAGHYSVPVVISDFPNIREDVKDNENGVTFEPESVADLIAKLKLLALNNDLCKELGRKNNEMTEKNHSERVSRYAIIKLVADLI